MTTLSNPECKPTISQMEKQAGDKRSQLQCSVRGSLCILPKHKSQHKLELTYCMLQMAMGTKVKGQFETHRQRYTGAGWRVQGPRIKVDWHTTEIRCVSKK
jgi:hypothetical protein